MNRHSRVAAALISVAFLASCSYLAPTTEPSETIIGSAPTSSSSPAPSSVTTANPIPTRSAVPARPPSTTAAQGSLTLYVLELVNIDRAQFGLDPVVLGDNPAAQIHAQDMFDNYFLSHWGTDGLKPYMRYTIGGGTNYEEENSAYSGWYDRSEDPGRYSTIDPRQELKELEYQMMYDDAGSNWGHRDNILNKWHKKVNIGIASDSHRLTLVEQFEGDYVEFTEQPALIDGFFSMSGVLLLGSLESVDIFYDSIPSSMTQSELLNGPRSYSLGERVVTVVSPPPPGYYYPQLPAGTVQASKWDSSAGTFTIRADLRAIVNQHGPGVYTVGAWAKAGGEHVMISTYSLFLR